MPRMGVAQWGACAVLAVSWVPATAAPCDCAATWSWRGGNFAGCQRLPTSYSVFGAGNPTCVVEDAANCPSAVKVVDPGTGQNISYVTCTLAVDANVDCTCKATWKAAGYAGCETDQSSCPSTACFTPAGGLPAGQSWCEVERACKTAADNTAGPSYAMCTPFPNACNCAATWSWRGDNYAGCQLPPTSLSPGGVATCVVEDPANCASALKILDPSTGQNISYVTCTLAVDANVDCTCKATWKAAGYAGCETDQSSCPSAACFTPAGGLPAGRSWCEVERACKTAADNTAGPSFALCDPFPNACNCAATWSWRGDDYAGCQLPPTSLSPGGVATCVVEDPANCASALKILDPSTGQNISYVTCPLAVDANVDCTCKQTWNVSGYGAGCAAEQASCPSTACFTPAGGLPAGQSWCEVEGACKTAADNTAGPSFAVCDPFPNACNCAATWSWRGDSYAGCQRPPTAFHAFGAGNPTCVVEDPANCASALKILDPSTGQNISYVTCTLAVDANVNCTCKPTWKAAGYAGCETDQSSCPSTACFTPAGGLPAGQSWCEVERACKTAADNTAGPSFALCTPDTSTPVPDTPEPVATPVPDTAIPDTPLPDTAVPDTPVPADPCQCASSWTLDDAQYAGCKTTPTKPSEPICQVIDQDNCARQSSFSDKKGSVFRYIHCSGTLGPDACTCRADTCMNEKPAYCTVENAPCKTAPAGSEYTSCTHALCTCKATWTYGGKMYNTCEGPGGVVPELLPSQRFCAVDAACKDGIALADGSNPALVVVACEHSTACDCLAAWEHDGVQYAGCQTTPDRPSKPWCQVDLSCSRGTMWGSIKTLECAGDAVQDKACDCEGACLTDLASGPYCPVTNAPCMSVPTPKAGNKGYAACDAPNQTPAPKAARTFVRSTGEACATPVQLVEGEVTAEYSLGTIVPGDIPAVEIVLAFEDDANATSSYTACGFRVGGTQGAMAGILAFSVAADVADTNEVTSYAVATQNAMPAEAAEDTHFVSTAERLGRAVRVGVARPLALEGQDLRPGNAADFVWATGPVGAGNAVQKHTTTGRVSVTMPGCALVPTPPAATPVPPAVAETAVPKGALPPGFETIPTMPVNTEDCDGTQVRQVSAGGAELWSREYKHTNGEAYFGFYLDVPLAKAPGVGDKWVGFGISRDLASTGMATLETVFASLSDGKVVVRDGLRVAANQRPELTPSGEGVWAAAFPTAQTAGRQRVFFYRPAQSGTLYKLAGGSTFRAVYAVGMGVAGSAAQKHFVAESFPAPGVAAETCGNLGAPFTPASDDDGISVWLIVVISGGGVLLLGMMAGAYWKFAGGGSRPKIGFNQFMDEMREAELDLFGSEAEKGQLHTQSQAHVLL